MATATNSPLTPDIITKEALTILHNNITFCRNVNRQYDNSNTMGGQKNSGAIRIRLPNKYVTNTGSALATGDTIDTDFAITKSESLNAGYVTAWLMDSLSTAAPAVIKDTVSWSKYIKYTITNTDTAYVRLVLRALRRDY